MRAFAVASSLAVCACAPSPAERPSEALSVSVEQASAFTRNFNPLLPGGARWPTRHGVYEPLMIWNGAKERWTPWLATATSFSADLRALRVTLRPGVAWSDGAPFSSADVAFTFELLRKHKAFDSNDVWGFLEGVRADGADAVELRFARPFVPGLEAILHQPIVPEHVFAKVADPLTFTNPNPVGTGPFTEVRVFRDQVYELGRNPRYWQPGKPAVKALRFLAFPGNDQANIALVDGSVDWAGNFVPAIDRTFVRRAPKDNHYWFPLLGGTVFLYANTARPPFDDARVRKALSMAVDRAKVVEVAMYGYTRPADATGLSDAFGSYRDAAAASAPWTRFDVDTANRLLDEAGCARGEGGLRTAPGGAPLRITLEVVSGWSDWVRAGQVIARGLGAVGVDAKLRLYDMGAWMDHLQRGTFDLAIAWSGEGATPYRFYRWLMSRETVQPVGTLAPANWHRFGDAASDDLLHAFERTDDDAERHRLMAALERRFAELAPAIPLFPAPQWGAYSTRRFEGFPSADDPYAKLTPNAGTESLLVLTALRPKGGS